MLATLQTPLGTDRILGGTGVRTHLANYRHNNPDLIGGGMRGYAPGKNRKVHRVTVTKNPQKYCLDNGALYSECDDFDHSLCLPRLYGGAGLAGNASGRSPKR